jgi:hypothetical protein
MKLRHRHDVKILYRIYSIDLGLDKYFFWKKDAVKRLKPLIKNNPTAHILYTRLITDGNGNRVRILYFQKGNFRKGIIK